jgi:hypothetical protein
VASEIKKVVMRADHRHRQQLTPDAGQHLFRRGLRRVIAPVLAPLRFCRLGQSPTVQLSIRQPGQSGQQHRGCRQHVLRQPLGEKAPQLFARHGFAGTVFEHDVGDQANLRLGALARHNDGLPDRRVLKESRLDLAGLDAESPDLDLGVDTAEELDPTVR